MRKNIVAVRQMIALSCHSLGDISRRPVSLPPTVNPDTAYNHV